MVFSVKKIGNGKNLFILIHGFPMSNDMFNGCSLQIPGYTVLLPNLPGFGHARIDDEERKKILSMEFFAEFIYELIQSSEYEKLVLGGVSMGGYVLGAFERLFPGISDAYILSNTKTTADPDGGLGREKAIQSIEEDGVGQYINDFIPKVLSEKSLNEREDIKAFIKEIALENDVSAIKGALLGMGTRPDSTSTMAKIQRPILIITGDDDKLTGKEIANSMANEIQHAIVKVIPNSGHFPMIENPEEYVKVIKSFLESL